MVQIRGSSGNHDIFILAQPWKYEKSQKLIIFSEKLNKIINIISKLLAESLTLYLLLLTLEILEEVSKKNYWKKYSQKLRIAR